jgi:magnesium transporter
MSVMASYLYRDGKRISSVPIDCAHDPVGENEFIWIGLYEPTPEELQLLQDNFGLHPLAVEDALHSHQMPKVDVYGDQLFVVARTAHLENREIAYGETAMFVGHNHIISVRHGSARAHTELRAQLEAAPTMLRHGPDYVLHAILDFIVDGYLPLVRSLEDEVLDMEAKLLDTNLGRQQITRIFKLRRETILFQRILIPMSEVAGKLASVDLPCLDVEVRPYFRDVLDHVRRVEGMVGGLREILTSVFEASNLLQQQQQGVITRQLAAWAAILAVPTAIAGIYGMNFEHMPELKTQYGYYVVLGVIGVICVGLYLRFKKSRWL